GIERATTPKVSNRDNFLIAGNPAAEATPSFEKNDVIVEIDGERISSIFDLKRISAEKFDQALTYVVEREVGDKTEQIAIQVQPNPARSMGVVTEWGPIKSIQKSSPAAEAGLLVGDKVVSINGDDPGDLYTLEQRMVVAARGINSNTETGLGESVSGDADSKLSGVIFRINRDGEEMDVEMNPRIPLSFALLAPGQPVAINSLGIAVESTLKVKESNVKGLESGDELVGLKFTPTSKEDIELYDGRTRSREFDLTEKDWTAAQQLVQQLPAGFTFELTAKRGKDEVKVDSATVVEEGRFIHTRGVLLSMLQKEYQSKTWSDAFLLGASRTYKDATRVFQFLGKLVQGQISPKNLGGPGMIAAAATSEATQGTSRLLLFLVLLSANLAIVNFLPIPVLDGGHMLFLAYEGLFRQPPNEKVQIILTYAGLFMILGLMAYVILLDIQRFTGIF
ncbi:MAG: site-2 protease family protein, partial [Planctomycetota bacterium]